MTWLFKAFNFFTHLPFFLSVQRRCRQTGKKNAFLLFVCLIYSSLPKSTGYTATGIVSVFENSTGAFMTLTGGSLSLNGALVTNAIVAHLHAQACSNGEAGGHFKKDTTIPGAPLSNELWASPNADGANPAVQPATGTWNGASSLLGFSFAGRSDVKAVVIHEYSNTDGTGFAPKRVCCDLAPTRAPFSPADGTSVPATRSPPITSSPAAVVVTTDTEATTTAKTTAAIVTTLVVSTALDSTTITIIAAVVGSVVVLLLVGGIVALFAYKKKQNKNNASTSTATTMTTFEPSAKATSSYVPVPEAGSFRNTDDRTKHYVELYDAKNAPYGGDSPRRKKGDNQIYHAPPLSRSLATGAAAATCP